MSTIAEIHSRRIPRREIRRVPSSNGNGSSPDPIEEATQTQREFLAMRMQRQAVDEVDADLETRRAETDARRAEAEAKRVEAQAKIEAIKGNNTQPQQQGSSDAMILVADLIDTMKGQNANLQEQIQALQQGAIANQVDSLRAELAALRQELMARAVGPSDGDNIQTLAARIEEVKQAKEALDPFFGSVPALSGVNSDINTTLLLHRLNSEHERWMAEYRATREDKDFERQLEWEKFRADRSRSESIASALQTMAPAILKGVEGLTTRVGIPTPVAAASVPRPTVLQCPGCNNAIEIQPGQDIALCSTCGQQYQVQESPA